MGTHGENGKEGQPGEPFVLTEAEDPMYKASKQKTQEIIGTDL